MIPTMATTNQVTLRTVTHPAQWTARTPSGAAEL
jgi:hypothetical protein